MIANVAVAFIVCALGTNVAGYYSVSSPYLGLVEVVAGAWIAVSIFRFASTQRGLRLKFGPYLFFWLILIGSPMVVMILGDRTFDAQAWWNQLFSVVSFLFGVVAGGNPASRKGVAAGAVSVVLVCAMLNFIEQFLHPNLWSTAPGRSAGWLLNPNISAAAIAGYTIIYMFTRVDKLDRLDIPVLLAAGAGVLVTFSRMGFILFAVAAMACFLARLNRDLTLFNVARFGLSVLAAVTVVALILPLVVGSLNLSDDTNNRIAFIFGEGRKDQSIEGREEVAENAWYEFQRNPLTGIGVRAVYDLPMGTGPHNMFATLGMEMGIFPLALYVVLILAGLANGFARLFHGVESGRRVILPTIVWLGLYSFASHNILTSYPDLLAIGLALGVASAPAALPSARSSRVPIPLAQVMAVSDQKRL